MVIKKILIFGIEEKKIHIILIYTT